MINIIIYSSLLQLLLFFILFFKDMIKYKIPLNLIRNRFYDNYIKKDIVLHGVSCGEVKSLRPIIEIIKSKKLDYYITSHTPTGYKIMKKYDNNVILKPYDSLFTMFYFFYKIKPNKLIIAESDSWPFYLIMAKLFNCKIFYINYKIKKSIIRNIYHYIFAYKIFLKEKQIIPYYLKDNKYEFIGNIKMIKNIEYNYKKINNSVIIASAHIDEIITHVKIIEYLLKNNYTVIYVPRHLNWKDFFINKIKDFDYIFIKDIKDIVINKLNIFWEIGVLNELYSLTQITIMGGTFDKTGGHDIVEPIIYKNMVYVGNSTHTITDLINIFNINYFDYNIKYDINNINYNFKKYNTIKNKINSKLINLID